MDLPSLQLTEYPRNVGQGSSDEASKLAVYQLEQQTNAELARKPPEGYW